VCLCQKLTLYSQAFVETKVRVGIKRNMKEPCLEILCGHTTRPILDSITTSDAAKMQIKHAKFAVLNVKH